MSSSVRYKYIVENLPLSVTARQLKAHFCKFGQIHTAEVYFDEKTGFSKCHGMVAFTRHLNVKEMEQVHKIHGEPVKVTRVGN